MMQIEHLALDAADWKIGGGQAVLLSCHYDVLDWNYTVAVNAKK